MRETLVIFQRELRSYFLSPIAYVFGVIFLGALLFVAAPLSLVDGAQAVAFLVRVKECLEDPQRFLLERPSLTTPERLRKRWTQRLSPRSRSSG